MDIDLAEEKAVARWHPASDTRFNRTLSFVVVSFSRFVMRGLNSLSIERADRLEALLADHDGRGLPLSNHVSLFDDPLLVSCLHLPGYRDIRWVAADALNFFDARWKAILFNAGKGVPIVRGSGFDQPGFAYRALRDLEVDVHPLANEIPEAA